MRIAQDLTGMRFGRLTVLDRASNRHSRPYWHCRCKCGKETTVQGNHLRQGATQSCGCGSSMYQSTHGHTCDYRQSSTYRSWYAMRKRCTDPNHKNWARYGGRGIKVDPRWDNFENFLADMGERPEGHTISRLDHDGGYGPSNCEWAPQGTH